MLLSIRCEDGCMIVAMICWQKCGFDMGILRNVAFIRAVRGEEFWVWDACV